MPNFELKFKTMSEGVALLIRTDVPYSRIIATNNLKLAKIIAKLMIGEEVRSNEWLDKVLSVKETEKEPDINSWNPGATFKQVVDRWEKEYGKNPSLVPITLKGNPIGLKTVVWKVL